ncbi:J domain-containing protein [Lacipirellula limnantheis]|uniref:Chaperone protein DnaJ n=1 Tax=Lacipirellula limnantheis TaxID=2528024 RepID=A0A517TWH4_9BACT|nr:J domain-containing protein [Lacipirellula limnantheis]QDT72723.1 Chaperone protein DnaJ [Lacipirellula limnantheis]
MTFAATTAGDAWVTPMHFVLAGATLGLIASYGVTRGRSGPLAALLFVLFGPVLGVAAMVASLLTTRNPEAADIEIFGIPFADFIELVVTLGVVAAFIGSAVYAFEIRDELRAYSEWGQSGWLGRLRTGVGTAPAMNALGLPLTATVDDVERAYRELAKQAHPDRGGDVEQFKRLQAAYERAKRQASGRPARSAPESPAPAAAKDA